MVGTNAVRNWPRSWSRNSSMHEMIFMRYRRKQKRGVGDQLGEYASRT